MSPLNSRKVLIVEVSVSTLGGRLEIETLEKGPKHGTRLKAIIPNQSWVNSVT